MEVKVPPYEVQDTPYPAIGDYGFISDCHATALVSRDGSIDWCCMPRIDSPSLFGRMLGWKTGGHCRIRPTTQFRSSRSYLEQTLILETHFATDSGKVRLLDFFPMRRGGRKQPYLQLLRILEGLEGEMPLEAEVMPRFEYGTVLPWIRRYGGNGFMAIGGADGLLISGDLPLEQADRHLITAACTVKKGESRFLSIIYRLPEVLDDRLVKPPDHRQAERRLEETIAWWRRWSAKGRFTGSNAAMVQRSALVLKGLTNAPTGAIAAAATASLPESPEGGRTWDYRFSWIRDSVFTVRSLAQIGFSSEADGFRRFTERSAAGSAAELQIMFGVGGERRLEEYELDSLEGYRGNRPVRIGNAAFRQVQLDIYGELLDLAWRWHMGGQSPDDDYWIFLVETVDEVGRQWTRADHGIWEVRTDPKHFVFSKVMCWSAVDKGLSLALELGRKAPVEQWRRLRDEIRSSIDGQGYDRRRGIYVQYYGGTGLDAALLRLPMAGYIPFDDPRMVRTVDAIIDELEYGGLIRRYPPGTDGFPKREGAFLACSFWLVECLAGQGRTQMAREFFERAVATANDLGLFAEQYDPERHEMLGNFPQALTHLSYIMAAMALEKVKPAQETTYTTRMKDSGQPAPP